MPAILRTLLLLSLLLTACSAYPAQGQVLDKYRRAIFPPGLWPRMACFATVRGHGDIPFPCDLYPWVQVGTICRFHNRHHFSCLPPSIARASSWRGGTVSTILLLPAGHICGIIQTGPSRQP